MLELANLAVERKVKVGVRLIDDQVRGYQVKLRRHRVKCPLQRKQKRLERKRVWDNQQVSPEE